MKNVISESWKMHLVTKGRAHVFGMDFETRDGMSRNEAVVRFDSCWEEKLQPCIEAGDEIAYEDAKKLLGDRQARFCNPAGQFRRFRAAGTLFVAQLIDDLGTRKNDQLWVVPQAGYDTRTLYVTFDKQEERDAWGSLATNLGFEDDELGKLVLAALLNALTKDK